MMTRILFVALAALATSVAIACGSSKPADQPPGQSSPASPASAWTTTGGPATPGAPATGSVETTDAGKR